MKRVLIIDDHVLVAAALSDALRSHGYEARACPVEDDEHILAVAVEFQPEVVLLDLELGRGRSGLSLIQPLRGAGPRVVMLSASTNPIRLAECLEAGADGLLSKGVRIEDVVRVVEGRDTHKWAPGTQQRELLITRLQENRARQHEMSAPFDSLTNRETEILAALVQGMTAQAIAEKTCTSVRTVRGHIQSVLDKLGVSSQLAAVALARNARWRREGHPSSGN